jgi:hypothetical protein
MQEKSNKKMNIYFKMLLVIVFIAFLYWLFRAWAIYQIATAMQASYYSKEIEISFTGHENKIYIKSTNMGIGGSVKMEISNCPDYKINKNCSVLTYGDHDIHYRQTTNTLIIYPHASSPKIIGAIMSETTESMTKKLGNINIEIISLDTTSFQKMIKNYKEQGISYFSVYGDEPYKILPYAE